MTKTEIFNFFDKIYCVHLPNDTRKQQIISEFEKFGIEDRLEFLHANPPTDGFQMSNFERSPRGEFGCNLSQIKAVIHALNEKASTPLIIEDDIVFNSRTLDILPAALEELPSDWEMLYLGGHPRGPYTIHSKHLAKVGKMSFADSYCIRGDLLVEFFDTWADKISRPKAAYDIILGNFALTKKCYCVYPIICEQRVGTSGITNQHEDKKPLITSRWQKWRT